MAEGQVETVQRRPEYIELREKALLDAIFGQYDDKTGFSGGLIQNPDMFKIAPYKIAERSGLENYANQFLSQDPQGFMSRTDPYFDQSKDAMSQGIGALTQAQNMITDPNTVQDFMNPYLDAVVEQSMSDINRAGDQALMRGDARAVKSGAFGGSRQGIQSAEIERNILDAKRKASSDLRSKGFQQAQKAAMEAGRLTGGIGQSLAGAAGKSADIGRVYGAMAPADLGFLSGVGQADRGYRQNVIEMARKEMQRPTEQALLPYNYAYGALSGTPSAGVYNQVQSTTAPATNPLLAGVGAYTTIQGINAQ
tara:strand:+ start:59 stop:985 length:927 start_codon:yes stop_codon:yes gene_type:complete